LPKQGKDAQKENNLKGLREEVLTGEKLQILLVSQKIFQVAVFKLESAKKKNQLRLSYYNPNK